MIGTHGTPFPLGTEQIQDFFDARAAGKAARTTYAATLLALAFLEEAGEVPADKRLAKHPALQNAAKEHATRRALQAKELGESSERRQAPPLLLGLLAPLEATVRDASLPRFTRAYAWYRLLRHWASLRFHDTSGMPPSLLTRRARGLHGLIERSKTSGADKGTAKLPLFVSNRAFVSEPWLWEGI